MVSNLFFMNFPEYLGLSCPFVRFSLNAKGPLVVKTFVVALEDAAMPETQVSSDSRAHLFLVFFFVLLLKVELKVFKQLSRHHKQALLVLERLFFGFDVRDISLFGLWSKIG